MRGRIAGGSYRGGNGISQNYKGEIGSVDDQTLLCSQFAHISFFEQEEIWANFMDTVKIGNG